MRAEFDLPDATPEDPNAPVPIWAVALRVKLGNATDIPGDQTLINVTCQFNKDGVRLADPSRAQDAPSNTPTNLDSPLSYGSYRPGCFGWWGPTKFNLDFAYSGIQAGPAPAHPHQVGEDLGYAVGCGFLEMLDLPKWGGLFDGPKLLLNLQNKYDRRLFSSTNLSTTDQSWIGALGVSIGTINYVGTMTARLKRFSVSLWV